MGKIILRGFSTWKVIFLIILFFYIKKRNLFSQGLITSINILGLSFFAQSQYKTCLTVKLLISLYLTRLFWSFQNNLNQTMTRRIRSDKRQLIKIFWFNFCSMEIWNFLPYWQQEIIASICLNSVPWQWQ